MHGGEKGIVGILKFIRLLIEIKLISKNMAARIFTWLDNSSSSETKKTDLINLPGVYGYAEGKKGNKNFSVGVTFDDSIQNLSMGEATSLPLSCGVKMFIDGLIKKKGIHAPESGIIDPKILILMGSTAMEALFGSKIKISKERGIWKEVIINNKTYLVMITFHPAYLLRQADQKKYSWADLKEIRKKIDELKLKI